MTIQIPTTQILTIQILKKCLKDYFSITNLNLKKKYICISYYNLQAIFLFFSKMVNIFSKSFKTTKNNYVFLLYLSHISIFF